MISMGGFYPSTGSLFILSALNFRHTLHPLLYYYYSKHSEQNNAQKMDQYLILIN
jgi:hypothetical protein